MLRSDLRFRRRRRSRGYGASQLSGAAGAFFVVQRKGAGDVGARRQALPDERRRDTAGRARGARVGSRDARLDGRSQVLRPPRDVAAHDAAAAGVRRGRVRGRARLRRLLDPRLAGDLGVGHAAAARPDLGDPRSRHRGADALADLRDRRPDHARGLLARSAPGREARRGVPARDRDRRHLLRRPRVRVLRLRRGQLRARPERGALLGRLERGVLELRQARASATRRGRRRATSRPRRTTRCTTSAPRWC